MPNIYLTGPRACGKSTVGPELARLLHAEFTDMDGELMRQNGRSIAQMVQEDGWDEFRRLESALLFTTAAPKGAAYTVIATGGGVVLAEENRKFLQTHGLTVYLQASPQVLAQRLLNNPDSSRRPSLTGAAVHQEAAAILAEREPLYLQCAALVQPADGAPKAVAQAIYNYIKRPGPA